MILVLVFLFFAVFGFSAEGQNLPDLYDVSGVSSDDVLNVRDAPSVQSSIIGALGPATTRIEVVRVEGNWGRIGLGEQSGWVSMSFLTLTPVDANTLPVQCLGTEPFWSLSIDDGSANYSTPDILNRPMDVRAQQDARNGFVVEVVDESTSIHTLVARSSFCMDGMSDREFGIDALFFMQTNEGNYVHQGCCTYQMN